MPIQQLSEEELFIATVLLRHADNALQLTACADNIANAFRIGSLVLQAYTGWPKKVSHYQVSSLNRIKNRH